MDALRRHLDDGGAAGRVEHGLHLHPSAQQQDRRLKAVRGFDAARVVAYTSLVQPVLKSDVLSHYDDVDMDTLLQLRERLTQVFDLYELSDAEIDDK